MHNHLWRDNRQGNTFQHVCQYRPTTNRSSSIPLFEYARFLATLNRAYGTNYKYSLFLTPLISGGVTKLMFDKLRAYAAKKGMVDAETANVGAVIGFIVMAVIMGIGVVILYQVETSTPNIANSSGWYTTQTTLASTTQSGYGLLGITSG